MMKMGYCAASKLAVEGLSSSPPDTVEVVCIGYDLAMGISVLLVLMEGNRHTLQWNRG